ncbi:branchpoint-bridging protein [Verticillium alfalfae VaMs.102]|uniref:Branchpoint-bridging protein n=1 Tax=Verticillium alfalfae (strain VaMs.102 / ATCC MYA-4576 / FGSC 10136) TaxID=526221 RepID=C9SAM5_VERA1|nr:branchpoint-bridging protein [Verticillium alfalfae VaMs.102]EEY15473.1 branchpoint-bridging protein [Verticillium alfalfae VaMs.102]
MTAEQLDAYVTHFRIREITHQLTLPDVLVTRTAEPGWRREHSPAPEYDTAGRRTNTRLQRRRRALEAERHRCIEEAVARTPSYQLPHDYRRPKGFADRIYIPQADFPAVNFIGQILGPRGATLKAMQERAGVTLAIRGKGSVKEGRGRSKPIGGASDVSSQPLHVLVTAITQRKVDEGKRLIQEVITNAVSTPEWLNEHKKQQLRDLAMANGTFRDDEGRANARAQDQVSLNPTRSLMRVESSLDVEFEGEYARLMEDILGSREGYTDTQERSMVTLPPWRVDRLRAKTT